MAASNDKIALITGASRGLGRALALQLARQGAHVIALGRTQGALADLDDAVRRETGHGATLIPFNLAEPDASFSKLGQALYERFKKLDLLVLNAAAIGPLSPLAHSLDKDWQKVMDVNVTANARLLRTFDPLLKTAMKPRVIFITCGAGSRAHNAYWGAYAASKKALEQMALSYKEETEKAGFTVDLIDPGPMATQLRRNAFPGEDHSSLPQPEAVAAALLGG